MSGSRLFAIFLIFVLAAVSWGVLAGSVEIRTSELTGRLGDAVSGLWGSPQVQVAPTFKRGTASSATLDVDGSDISARFELDQRRKGLLWYSTYVVDLAAQYTVSNPTTKPVDASVEFAFPDPTGIYDGFAVKVDGTEVPVTYNEGRATARFPLAAGASARIDTGYRTNGMDSWAYSPNPAGAGVIRDFHLAMATDFDGFDYPEDGVSPTSQRSDGRGRELLWDYESVVSGRNIGIVMPKPMNPGPLVSRITLFAPVSLLFFFASLILLTATRNVRLHPVHYGFLAAAFFAFHLLLAYLADQVDINMAFTVAAAVSVALVVSYLHVVVGRNRALLEIAIGQLIFLVLFSYSFFFEGFTGLAITVGAVLTLAFFMHRTARLDWETVFPKKDRGVVPQWVQLPNGQFVQGGSHVPPVASDPSSAAVGDTGESGGTA